MRNYVLSLAAAVSLGAAIPAMAYDFGGLLSMQDALGVATDIGLVTVSIPSSPVTNGKSRDVTCPASILKSTSTPPPAPC